MSIWIVSVFLWMYNLNCPSTFDFIFGTLNIFSWLFYSLKVTLTFDNCKWDVILISINSIEHTNKKKKSLPCVQTYRDIKTFTKYIINLEMNVIDDRIEILIVLSNHLLCRKPIWCFGPPPKYHTKVKTTWFIFLLCSYTFIMNFTDNCCD